VQLVWESAAQHWNGRVQGDAWEVGDGSFYLGDGTAELGQTELEFTLSGTTLLPQTITHNGNIEARNVRIEVDWSSGESDFTIANQTAGYELIYGAAGLSADATLVIDCGARLCYQRDNNAPKTIFSIARRGARLYVTTTAAHGLTDGDHIEISGTTGYNGFYRNIDVTSTTTLNVLAPDLPASVALELAGVVRECVDGYGDLTAQDKSNWFMLAPGANLLTLQNTTAAGDATVRISFYDHYA
jgi:hypothetical protein